MNRILKALLNYGLYPKGVESAYLSGHAYCLLHLYVEPFATV